MNHATISPAPIRQSIRVEAPPARAYDVFVSRMGSWWNPAYSINRSPMKDVVVEKRAGGRWLEVGEDGSEYVWGKVLIWEPPSRLVLAWQINADWKFEGDLVTELELRFVPDGQRFTRVELEHRNLERLGEGDKAEAVRAALQSPDGWGGLLTRFGEVVGSAAA
jgi:uncharacterized protein YndB with AHSA1/START domain